MPNWATGSMTLVLPTKNADKFLSFIERNEDKHFYRTTFTENEAPANNSHGLTKLSFNVECAWSAENCLVNPDADAEDCIPFEEFIYIFCLDNKWRYIDLCKEAPPTLKQIPKKFAGNYYDEEKVKLKPNSIAWEDLFQMDKNKNNGGE